MPPLFRRAVSASERLVQIDLSTLARGGGWLTLGQIVTAGISLALALVFANVLPKETYGTYKYALSIAGLLSIFALPGMGTAVSRAVAQGKDASLIPATYARMRFGLIGAAIGLAAALYYGLNGNASLTIILIVLSAFLPVYDVFTTFNAYLLGKQNFKTSALISIWIQGISTILIIAVAFYTKNAIVILAVYFASYSLLRFLAYRHVRRTLAADVAADPDTVSYGKHLSLMGLLGTVAANIDNLVLFHFIGPAQVAIYAIATAAPDQLKSVLGSFPTLIFPTLARESESDSKRAMPYRFLLFFALSAGGILIYILLAPLFFDIFFHQYVAYVFLSQIFALSLLTITFDPALLFLNAHKRIREQYWSTTIGNIMQIVSIIVLAMLYGVWGVILARIIVRFLSNLLNVYFYYVPLKKAA